MKFAHAQLYSRNLNGHRLPYLKFYEKLLSGERASLQQAVFDPRPTVFLTVEDSFMLYCFVALWRNFFGKITIGFLLRPKPAVEAKSLRLKIKYYFLKVLRQQRNIKTLSIVPVPLEPSIAGIVDDWIYDCQLWDLTEADHELFLNVRSGLQMLPITSNVSEFAAGRHILASLGIQDYHKGLDLLTQLQIDLCTSQEWMVLSAGKYPEVLSNEQESIKATGGLVIDRYMSDDEMIAVYAVSSAVWCAYHDSYDQASGILGRAVQLGVPVVVKANSVSHRFCLSEDIPHMVYNSDCANALKNYRPSISESSAHKVLGFRKKSIDTLVSALGDLPR